MSDMKVGANYRLGLAIVQLRGLVNEIKTEAGNATAPGCSGAIVTHEQLIRDLHEAKAVIQECVTVLGLRWQVYPDGAPELLGACRG